MEDCCLPEKNVTIFPHILICAMVTALNWVYNKYGDDLDLIQYLYPNTQYFLPHS